MAFPIISGSDPVKRSGSEVSSSPKKPCLTLPRSSLFSSTPLEKASLALFRQETQKQEVEADLAAALSISLFKQVVSTFPNCEAAAPETESEIAELAFDLAEGRLCQTNPLRSEEIISIYHLLFETGLAKYSSSSITKANPCAPHPAYVFRQLYLCLDKLKNFNTFQDVIEAGKSFIHEKSGLNAILAQFQEQSRGLVDAEEILCLIREQNAQAAQEIGQDIRKCPVYSLKEWFGGDYKTGGYVLRDPEGQPAWIFKPVTVQNGLAIAPERALREHTASLVNFHAQFSIPYVVHIEFKGWTGSAQLYLPGCRNKASLDIKEYAGISALDLQKALIFDLLFSNCDRHENNFLFKANRLFLIDHDQCMEGYTSKPLKIDYLDFDHAFNRPFAHNISDLVSPKTLETYQTIMQAQGISSEAISWMKKAGKMLQQGIEEQKSARQCCRAIFAAWQNVKPC